MSSFVWMKVLESAPERYDRGIRMLSGGHIEAVYDRVAALAAAPGKRVLDMGCGTGGVALACAARGANVTGIDIDAGMLEIARTKRVPAEGHVEFIELGVAEIEDRFAVGSFDAVVSCLAMSELSPEEQAYALQTAFSRLIPGGVIVIADEAWPAAFVPRLVHRLKRMPIAAMTYLLTQTTTHPVEDLSKLIQGAGFSRVKEEGGVYESFVIVSGVKVAS